MHYVVDACKEEERSSSRRDLKWILGTIVIAGLLGVGGTIFAQSLGPADAEFVRVLAHEEPDKVVAVIQNALSRPPDQPIGKFQNWIRARLQKAQQKQLEDRMRAEIPAIVRNAADLGAAKTAAKAWIDAFTYEEESP